MPGKTLYQSVALRGSHSGEKETVMMHSPVSGFHFMRNTFLIARNSGSGSRPLLRCLSARHFSKGLTYSGSCNVIIALVGPLFMPTYPEEGTEVQENHVIGPRSYSWYVAEPGSEPSLFGIRPQPSTPSVCLLLILMEDKETIPIPLFVLNIENSI